jgi:hypothetical protein
MIRFNRRGAEPNLTKYPLQREMERKLLSCHNNITYETIKKERKIMCPPRPPSSNLDKVPDC